MCGNCNWEEAHAQAQELLELLDQLPDAAEEFAESVREKTEGILVWIEESEHVTDAQETALENMFLGAEKWLR